MGWQKQQQSCHSDFYVLRFLITCGSFDRMEQHRLERHTLSKSELKIHTLERVFVLHLFVLKFHWGNYDQKRVTVAVAAAVL